MSESGRFDIEETRGRVLSCTGMFLTGWWSSDANIRLEWNGERGVKDDITWRFDGSYCIVCGGLESRVWVIFWLIEGIVKQSGPIEPCMDDCCDALTETDLEI